MGTSFVSACIYVTIIGDLFAHSWINNEMKKCNDFARSFPIARVSPSRWSLVFSLRVGGVNTGHYPERAPKHINIYLCIRYITIRNEDIKSKMSTFRKLGTISDLDKITCPNPRVWEGGTHMGIPITNLQCTTFMSRPPINPRPISYF